MKYIRTKDGHIFEVEKDLGRYGKSKAVIICDFNGYFIDVEKQDMILKQADTIEELCDEFIYHFLISDRYEIMPRQDLEPQRRDCLLFHIVKRHHDVLGAIWTDKGLIYVAKMNDKGEWELL